MEKKARIQDSKEAARKERQSEATSKDTLSDLEQFEKISNNAGGRQPAEPPAPDDAGGKRRRAPDDDAGPM